MCAQAQFSKLRGICVAAEQGMRSLAQRLSLALEAPALTIGPSSSTHDAAAAAAPLSAGAVVPPGGASRLTSAGGMSSASGSHADMRRSGAGGGSGSAASQHHRRPSKDHGLEGIAAAQQSALASKAQRCVCITLHI